MVDILEEVLPGLYRIEIPLPESPLKSLNSYVIKAPGRNLIIDTGLNRVECFNAMHSGLREISIDLGETDFIITHMHRDHAGLISTLATDTSVVYCTQQDAEVLNSADNIRNNNLSSFTRSGGFPEKDSQGLAKLWQNTSIITDLEFTHLKDGDILTYGGYQFACIETPGHTKGHMCLYETGGKVLISGDHILGEITPNITSWSDDENPLADYLKSLDKVYPLDIQLVLPGHRAIFTDCKQRIAELKLHHKERLAEIVFILENGKKDAFEVAEKMAWNMAFTRWELIPTEQRLFASGEALAHLNYLEAKGKVCKDFIDHKVVFSLK